MDLAPVVIVTVYSFKARNVSVGVNVAVMPSYATVPGTTVVPCFTMMVDELMVAGSIAVLNDISIALLRETFVALFTGLVAVTVGPVSGSLSSSVQADTNRRNTIENNDKS